MYVFMYSLIDDSKITLDAGWKLELDKKPSHVHLVHCARTVVTV